MNDPLSRWLAWFDEKSPPELIKEGTGMDSAVMAAYMQQDFITQNEEAWQEYWMHRKMEHDRVSNLNGAREEGEQIGRAEEKIEIARNALTRGLSIEMIHDITGLPTETIEWMLGNGVF